MTQDDSGKTEKTYSAALALHREHQGKLAVASKVPLDTRADLALAYTPGVAAVCGAIANSPDQSYALTMKGNSVAVVSDGSAILGLGNLGPLAALPVMEGKCVLFKHFANIDAFPLCLKTQDPQEIIDTVERISPVFGAICLEDIAAPACFAIEAELNERLDIPVVHDDQHATATVVLAGLINALRLTGKDRFGLKVVVLGSGAAGIATAKLMRRFGIRNIILVDRAGAVYEGRHEHMNSVKEQLALLTNPDRERGSLVDVLHGADVFIGVSGPGLVTPEMVRSMRPDPVIFALANPTPEIMPEVAREAGARLIATGRSDYDNQVNNVLVFPGMFRGLLDARTDSITPEVLVAAAHALAHFVDEPTPNRFIPSIFEPGIAQAVAGAVEDACRKADLVGRRAGK